MKDKGRLRDWHRLEETTSEGHVGSWTRKRTSGRKWLTTRKDCSLVNNTVLILTS